MVTVVLLKGRKFGGEDKNFFLSCAPLDKSSHLLAYVRRDCS